MPLDREALGKIVCNTYREWAFSQYPPKEAKPWEELSEPLKDLDRRIGEDVAVRVFK